MKLYLVHCGFYDTGVCEGVYEFHINLLVAASTFEEARVRVKDDPEFQKRKMHVDGLQEIVRVNGYAVNLIPDSERNGETILISNRHRDL